MDEHKPPITPEEDVPPDEPGPKTHQEADDEVEEASEDSFPASDPPSFTRSSTTD